MQMKKLAVSLVAAALYTDGRARKGPAGANNSHGTSVRVEVHRLNGARRKVDVVLDGQR